jgi:hypothetical protein
MLHLRLVVTAELARPVLDHLVAAPGVAHVAILLDASAKPTGHVVLCDVVREAGNEVVEWLQRQGIHHSGAIIVESLEAVVSDAAAAAEADAPGQSADALIWEELDARARDDSALTTSFLRRARLDAMGPVTRGPPSSPSKPTCYKNATRSDEESDICEACWRLCST